jgi:hypothetical protein
MIKKSEVIGIGLSFRKVILNSNYGFPKKYLYDDDYHDEYFRLKKLYRRLRKIEKIWKNG